MWHSKAMRANFLCQYLLFVNLVGLGFMFTRGGGSAGPNARRSLSVTKQHCSVGTEQNSTYTISKKESHWSGLEL